MFLNLNHYKLDVYKSARELRFECYKILPKVALENLKLKEKDILKFQEAQ